MERSIMDEASNMALRSLHKRIEELERERRDWEKREHATEEQLHAATAELEDVKVELSRRDEAERELKDGIARAQEQMESMDISMAMSLEEGDRLRLMSTIGGEEEKKALTAANETLRAEQLTLETQLADAREEVLKKDGELGVLKAELEAQWRHTESMGERIAEAERERDEAKRDVEAFTRRMEEMEEEWTLSKNKKNELEAEVQEIWTAKEDLEKQLIEVRPSGIYSGTNFMLMRLCSLRTNSVRSRSTPRSSHRLSASVKTKSLPSTRNTSSRSIGPPALRPACVSAKPSFPSFTGRRSSARMTRTLRRRRL